MSGEPQHFLHLMNVSEFRQMVDQRRQDLGYRWSDLARMCGLSTPYLHQLLHGKKTNPSQYAIEALVRLMQHLGIGQPSRPDSVEEQPARRVLDLEAAPQIVGEWLSTLHGKPRVLGLLLEMDPRRRMGHVIQVLLDAGVEGGALADALGVTRATLDDLLDPEKEQQPPPGVALNLARVTELSMDFLWKGKPPETPAHQELHAMLDQLLAQGVALERVHGALLSLAQTRAAGDGHP